MKARSSVAGSRGISRLGGLLLATPIVLLILASVVGLVCWQYFKGTPAYSLSLLVDASQRNNSQQFDDLFDIKQVVENLVKDTTQRATNSSTLGNDLIQRLQPVSAAVSEAIKPILRERLRERINAVGPAADLPFFLKALAIWSRTDEVRETEKIRITIRHQDDEIQLWLAPHHDRWKVIAIRDDQLAAEVVAEISRRVQPSRVPLRGPGGLTLPDVERLIPPMTTH